jgi:DUF4097 and DUF4098 domain-containing protein YvlB
MKTNLRFTRILALLAALAGGVGLALAATEDTLHKSFTVSPGGRLLMAVSRGAIEIQTGADNQVAVEVFRKVTRVSESKARDILDSHEITFTQEGDTVAVRDKAPRQWSEWSWWGGGNLQVRYTVTVPRQFNLDLKTAGGSITVPDLTGGVALHTSGGSLKVGAIDGPVTAGTAGGSIAVASATGVIEAKTSGGGIEVGEAKAAANLGTSGGGIRVKLARGPLTAKTSGGGIEISEAHGAVEAVTAGGSVTASLAGSPAEECRLSTSGGSVRLQLPATANADIDAKTSGGSVKTELPVTVQGTARRNELVGKLGAGGQLVRLRTSGGNITLSGR